MEEKTEKTEKTDTKKSNLIKLAIGVVLALAGAGGADAAGVEMPDLTILQQLGVVTSIAVVAYLHQYIRPHVLEVRDDQREMLGLMRTVAAHLTAAQPAAVEEEAPRKTKPVSQGLKVLKTHKD